MYFQPDSIQSRMANSGFLYNKSSGTEAIHLNLLPTQAWNLSIKFCRQINPIQHTLWAHNPKQHLAKLWMLDLIVTLSHRAAHSSLNTFVVYTVKYMHTSLQKQGPKGNGYKGLESCSCLSKLFKMAPGVEYVSLESQFMPTWLGLSMPAKSHWKILKTLEICWKKKVLLTKDVSLSCIDFQLWLEETL